MNPKNINFIGSKFSCQRMHLTCRQEVCAKSLWVGCFYPPEGKS